MVIFKVLVFYTTTILLGVPAYGQIRTGQNKGTKASPKNPKPNFVLFLMDDLGWADIGVNGSTFYQTPHLDALAARSMQFKNAYAASPVCSPTRAALLTGKHPARLQLTDWLPGRADQPSQKLLRADLKSTLPLAEVTLAEALKSAGYVSAHVGKWHLGAEGFGPLEQGFDQNIGGDHSGSPASYFSPYANPSLPEWRIPGLPDGPDGEYLTDRLTREAESFITENKDKPFLLYLPHFAVHIPLKAKEELVQKYRQLSSSSAQNNAIYAAMVESMDESVGSILRKLKALNLAENTVVIFTSDNGGLHVKEGPNTPATSNAPLRSGKGTLYEGGIRVPLLIYAPGKHGNGLVSYVPVTTADLFFTVLDLAGLAPKKGTTSDGRSLIPLLRKKTFAHRNLYWHYPHYSNQGGKPGWAIRQGDYKLIEFFEEGRLELYNLRTDRSEQQNLVSQLPKKVQALKTALHQWGKAVGAQHMKENPAYKPAAE